MNAPEVTTQFFGYGTAGIIGTLIGGRLVARSRVGTFAGAALAAGAALIVLPEMSMAHLAAGIVIVAWGPDQGTHPAGGPGLDAPGGSRSPGSGLRRERLQHADINRGRLSPRRPARRLRRPGYRLHRGGLDRPRIRGLCADRGPPGPPHRPHNGRVPSPGSTNSQPETAKALGRKYAAGAVPRPSGPPGHSRRIRLPCCGMSPCRMVPTCSSTMWSSRPARSQAAAWSRPPGSSPRSVPGMRAPVSAAMSSSYPTVSRRPRSRRSPRSRRPGSSRNLTSRRGHAPD